MNSITPMGWCYVVYGTLISFWLCAAGIGKWQSPQMGGGSGGAYYSGGSSYGRSSGGFWGGGK